MMQGDTCRRADAPSVLGLVIGLIGLPPASLCRPHSRIVSKRQQEERSLLSKMLRSPLSSLLPAFLAACLPGCLPFCACPRGSGPSSWSVRLRGFAAEVQVLGLLVSVLKRKNPLRLAWFCAGWRSFYVWFVNVVFAFCFAQLSRNQQGAQWGNLPPW